MPPLEAAPANREDFAASLARDRALRSRALRRREEIATERRRFELQREKVYLVLELIAVALALILFLEGKSAEAVLFLGGGAGFGLRTLLHRRPPGA